MTDNQALAIIKQLERIADGLESIECALSDIFAWTPPERICKDCKYSTSIEDAV